MTSPSRVTILMMYLLPQPFALSVALWPTSRLRPFAATLLAATLQMPQAQLTPCCCSPPQTRSSQTSSDSTTRLTRLSPHPVRWPRLKYLQPTPPPLCLDDGAFYAALRLRLGEFSLPSGSQDAACFCGARLSGTDAKQALSCRFPNALRVLRNDDIGDIMRRMLRRGGVPSTKEPRLPVLHIQGPSSARSSEGARKDLLSSF
jgi:hypothetical protein